MITSLTLVPSPPALLPEHVGRVDPLAELRRDAVALLARLPEDSEPDRPVVLVVASDPDARSSRTPLGQRIGEHLLGRAGRAGDRTVVVPWDATLEQVHHLAGTIPTASRLVVVGDGSACRSEKAPGHLDQRSFGYDEATLGALQAADPRALLDLDPDLGAQLLAIGRAPLQVAAAAALPSAVDSGPGAAPAYRCDGATLKDPFGVAYLLARWSVVG